MPKEYRIVRFADGCEELNDAADDGFEVVPGTVTWSGGWQALVERTRRRGPSETQEAKKASETK